MARRRAEAPRRPSFAQYLVIMAKSPHLGRVKRRLGREIGDVAAHPLLSLLPVSCRDAVGA